MRSWDDRPRMWQEEALCAQVDHDVFFPVDGGGHIGLAKAICARCPVQVECLQYAITNPELTEHGVWGGASVPERKAMRRRVA